MEVCKITLKGEALLLAIDSGLIRKNVFGGYNITPFERFWNNFLPVLKNAPNEGEDNSDMLCNHSDKPAED